MYTHTEYVKRISFKKPASLYVHIYTYTEYAKRISFEASARCDTIASAHLTAVETTRFVDIIKPILLMSLFAKSPQMVMVCITGKRNTK